MDKQSTNRINVGGNIETALSGKYTLSMGAVVSEAWKLTLRHFVRFTPAILALMLLQLVIFYVALSMQIDDLPKMFAAFANLEQFDPSYISAIVVANFSYEVISAPFFASLCMMAMSHSTGFNTKPSHLTKGLAFTVPVILATLASLLFQATASYLIPILSLYLSVAFSHSILLICEKRMTPLQSLWMSLRASNKKIFVLFGLYSLIILMLIASVALWGIGLVITLPFYFHVKAIVYREMFGVTLTVVASKAEQDEVAQTPTADTPSKQPSNSSNNDSDTFDA